ENLQILGGAGSDGFPMEFYMRFWQSFSTDLVCVLNVAYETGQLSTSQRRGLIIILYKKNDHLETKNWRPISHLNVDYKIATRALLGSLLAVIGTVVGTDQMCGVPGHRFNFGPSFSSPVNSLTTNELIEEIWHLCHVFAIPAWASKLGPLVLLLKLVCMPVHTPRYTQIHCTNPRGPLRMRPFNESDVKHIIYHARHSIYILRAEISISRSYSMNTNISVRLLANSGIGPYIWAHCHPTPIHQYNTLRNIHTEAINWKKANSKFSPQWGSIQETIDYKHTALKLLITYRMAIDDSVSIHEGSLALFMIVYSSLHFCKSVPNSFTRHWCFAGSKVESSNSKPASNTHNSKALARTSLPLFMLGKGMNRKTVQKTITDSTNKKTTEDRRKETGVQAAGTLKTKSLTSDSDSNHEDKPPPKTLKTTPPPLKEETCSSHQYHLQKPLHLIAIGHSKLTMMKNELHPDTNRIHELEQQINQLVTTRIEGVK
ncbi:Hypothetical predicted protein, partial [Paramuricea clavata]